MNTRSVRACNGSEARSRLASAPPEAERKLMTSHDWTERAHQPLLTVHHFGVTP